MTTFAGTEPDEWEEWGMAHDEGYRREESLRGTVCLATAAGPMVVKVSRIALVFLAPDTGHVRELYLLLDLSSDLHRCRCLDTIQNRMALAGVGFDLGPLAE